MNPLYISIAETLRDIEKELRGLHLWELEMLPADALASDQPFAIDTMTFPQWLQFLLDQQLPLPSNCGIAPMAEQYFAPLNIHSSALITYLHQIDALLTTKT
jgi:uncharacterized protein YqcC (DUF446 family)